MFVHPLPTDATTESLTEFFSQSFPIKHTTVVTDSNTKQCKGYGFVTFADADDAQNAKDTLNGSTYHGKRIRLETAEPRHRAPRGEDAHQEGEVQDGARSTDSGSRPELDRLKSQRPPKLIVRNLPWSIKESEQLVLLFRSFGKVKYATVPKKHSGLSAGYGFVTLRGAKNAEKALREMNGKEVDGRQLAVDYAVDKAVWQTLQEKGYGERTDNEVLNDPEEESSVKSEDSHSMDVYDVATSEDEQTLGSDAEDALSSIDNGTEEKVKKRESSDNLSTLFIRNVPFEVTDEMIIEHFSSFGPVRYGRMVMDPLTERSRGTAFVSFYNAEDAKDCLRTAPKIQPQPSQIQAAGTAISASSSKRSLLENTSIDPSGRYTLHDRVLQVSRAVDRGEAKRLTLAGSSVRDASDRDKRRLYLLSEGTISANSSLYHQLPPSEIKMREDSAKQRQTLIKSNPALHLSLTRLSVRNIPRSLSSKELKELARKAVVGFASDVKAGTRRPLSKEELARGGEEMKKADRERKAKGKGIVKQAKIVFEGLEGSKVREDSGAGRSRGYGFIEYTSHRAALMGLRWLNGHMVEANPSATSSQDLIRKSSQNHKKRLITEFAIENAQVVGRRREREAKARERSKMCETEHKSGPKQHANADRRGGGAAWRAGKGSKKTGASDAGSQIAATKSNDTISKTTANDKMIKRQHNIARKRKLRRSGKSTSVN